MRAAFRRALLLTMLAFPWSKAAFGIPQIEIKGQLPPTFFNFVPLVIYPIGLPAFDSEDGILRRYAVKAKPASQGNSKMDCSKPSTKNPVMIATGEKYKVESDFASGSRYGLNLERTYRSKHASGTLFGPNWLSNLDPARITASSTCTRRFANWPCAPDSFTLTEPDGTRYTYTYKSYSLATGEVGQSTAGQADDAFANSESELVETSR